MAAKSRTSAGIAVGQGFIGFGLVAIGVIGSLATVLGFFGSTWWLFDFVANFRAHLAVVLLLVALIYSLIFSKTTGLFFMLMAIVNGIVVLPLYLGNPAPAAASDVFTVVSFNVSQRASIRDLTFSWIDTVEPDLVVLTNVTADWLNGAEVAAPYRFLNELPVDRTFGIAVLARDELEVETLRITPVRDVVARVEASIGDRPVVIFAVQSPASSNEADAEVRDEYFAEVASLAREETVSTVVVGDFESTSWSHTFRSLLADADLVDSLEGYGIQTTWPTDRWTFLRLPFDHLVHSPDLTTVDRYTGPPLGVEHKPIVVKLAPAV